MKVIKFAGDMEKLENEEFTTIRISDKHLALHEAVKIESNSYSFLAKCTSMKYVQLGKIHAMLLCRDLNIDFDYFLAELSHGHLLDKLRAVHENYKDLTWESFVYLYNFEKCEEENK